MNNSRRKQIKKAHDLLMQAQEIIDQCAFEESECFDNLPEGMV